MISHIHITHSTCCCRYGEPYDRWVCWVFHTCSNEI